MKYILLTIAAFFPTTVLGATQLEVPFTPQAPDGVWVQPWQDACEEASIFMVDRFYQEENIANAEVAKTGILEIFTMKHQRHGESLDETAETVADLINAYLPWSAYVVDNPSIKSITDEIDAGRPVIVPFAAPLLKNPHFTSDFPYHMAVISGYNDEKQTFIVEEPGTQYGYNFSYTYATVMNAMHDFVAGDVSSGEKRVIFTSPELGSTTHIDADNDGLTKAEEIQHGTVTYYADSDGDGFLDGIEAQFGYLPTKDEQALVTSGTLLKSPSSPKVYVVQDGKKRHVASEDVFYKYGWNWTMLEQMSDAMMKTIPEGAPLT